MADVDARTCRLGRHSDPLWYEGCIRGREGCDRPSLLPIDRNGNKALILIVSCDLGRDGGP